MMKNVVYRTPPEPLAVALTALQAFFITLLIDKEKEKT
jgi:hypothetical protein